MISIKKFISIIAACVGALLLAAGIGLPSASADPTNAPGPSPTMSNQPPADPDEHYIQKWDEGVFQGPRS